jgi:hypothetical protein
MLLNDTHASTTDPEARKYRKSRCGAFLLVHMVHVLSENQNGLAIGVRVSVANPKAERETALELLRAVCGGRRSENANGSRRFSGGSKASLCCAKCVIEDERKSDGCSRWQRRLTT